MGDLDHAKFTTKGGSGRVTTCRDLRQYLMATRGESGFSSSSTAEQVVSRWDGTGKTAIVTGASSGLGEEAARALASRGCEVILAVRSQDKGAVIAEEIRKGCPAANVAVMELDLLDLASVKRFVASFRDSGRPLNILMCNAGLALVPFQTTKEGQESQFATNHLGHFLLVTLLLDVLSATAVACGQDSRVVVLASLVHHFSYPGGIDFRTLTDPDMYNMTKAYGQSKLCNILFTRLLNEKLQGRKVTAVCCHPGSINTDLGRHLTNPLMPAVMLMARPFMKSIAQGAATQVFLATAEGVCGGEYYEDCNIASSSPWSHDKLLAKKLWTLSEDLCRQYL